MTYVRPSSTDALIGSSMAPMIRGAALWFLLGCAACFTACDRGHSAPEISLDHSRVASGGERGLETLRLQEGARQRIRLVEPRAYALLTLEDGSTLRALIDTGSTELLVSSDCIRKSVQLKKKGTAKGRTAKGEYTGDLCELNSLKWGETAYSDVVVIIANRDDIPAFCELGMDALIGTAFWESKRLWLDLAERFIVADAPSGALPTSVARTKSSFRNGLVTVQAANREHAFQLALDTGSAQCILSQALCKRARLEVTDDSRGTVGSKKTIVPELVIGECTLREVPAIVSDTLIPPAAEVEGILGCNALYALGGVVIDYRTKEVAFPYRTSEAASAAYAARAAEGKAWAKGALGLRMFRGIGVESQPKKGLELLKEAADSDDAETQLMLGEAYMYGAGLERDHRLAYEYLSRAAKSGLPEALRGAASLLLAGSGTEKDIPKAVKLLEEASRAGDIDAHAELGRLYAVGVGVAVDPEKAFELTLWAGRRGNRRVAYMLGKWYAQGTGVQTDSAEALRWFRVSAESGDPFGMHAMGICYESGYGTHVDVVTAKGWYRRAAAAGSEDAKAALSRLGEKR